MVGCCVSRAFAVGQCLFRDVHRKGLALPISAPVQVIDALCL